MKGATVSAEEEARHLLELHAASGLEGAVATVTQQFGVIQTRSQLLLSLATITLTISGFSGPAIASSGRLPQIFLAIGILLVMLSTLVLLLGNLRIRWLTQFVSADAAATLTRMIEHRNRKTRFFLVELLLIVVGLFFYVLSLVTYVLTRPV